MRLDWLTARPIAHRGLHDGVSAIENTTSAFRAAIEGGYLHIVRTGFRPGDGGEKAFIELLGSEKIIDEKRQKRAEARAKRAEETRKAMEEAQQAEQGGEAPASGAAE